MRGAAPRDPRRALRFLSLDAAAFVAAAAFLALSIACNPARADEFFLVRD